MALPAHLMHPNAGVRRGRENAMKALDMEKHEMGKGSEHDGHGPVVRTEVAGHKDGSAHVIAHHADGHAAIHHHPNVGAADKHAAHLKGGGDGHQEHPASTDPMEDEQQRTAQAGDVDNDGMAPGAEAEQECPECGGKMEDDGEGGEKCTQCGYEHKEEDDESPHGQATEALEA